MTEMDTDWTVITGSTGGIGSELAKQLVARGDALILVNRSETKTQEQLASLVQDYPLAKIELVTADLMDTQEIFDAANKINQLPGRVDVLYNNSGILTSKRVLSKQGFESQFAVNTLAPYLLIRLLRNKMARSSFDVPAMIVNFSSSAITPLKSLDVDNLVAPEEVGGLMTTYAQTKLAVTMFAPALAEELLRDNILIRAVDPGATKSAMTTSNNDAMPKVLAWLAPLLFSPADKQAQKVIESADPMAFDGRSGIYVANKKEKKLPPPAIDASAQDALIKLCDRYLST
ncbi:MAG: SDR family NAD(P)-dependent oxidoreductase [Kordiimonadaceae bacterium]|nr:SDR family NAD(P)-dependent oxidoreductase [Kordiimonadaceae bacterium]MBO6568594.1 SDR family NAD(P)-dependent oxidoreductase [Kordiimonadaceae bacterium]MBO6965430.1 SDR family NAD(P)-dependent oxidoreductase [Kordiimonadaceae bacterium]